MNPPRTFLTAEWRMAAMLNYEVDAALLEKLVPSGTELDRWQGKLFVSLVGFRFLNTKVLGMAIPFHRNFDEVNLRFYVRRQAGDEVRRGVVFIREIVPRWAIATVARVVYNENYVALPMWRRIEPREDGGVNAEYGWRTSQGRNQIILKASGQAALPEEGSEAQFITEHYWGYAAQRDGGAWSIAWSILPGECGGRQALSSKATPKISTAPNLPRCCRAGRRRRFWPKDQK
jgi:uncharacterized protein YqjF (DUF2071 family)